MYIIEYLEIFGQLGTSSITGVHCDENTDSWDERNFDTFENEAFFLVTDGILDRFDLIYFLNFMTINIQVH